VAGSTADRRSATDSHAVVRENLSRLDGDVRREPTVLHGFPISEMKLRLPEHLLYALSTS
jgi:hypothetical protein